MWINPPEPGEPYDPGEYEYCSCADGEQRRRADMRLVDRLCNEIIDDEILEAPLPRRQPVKAVWRPSVRRKAG